MKKAIIFAAALMAGVTMAGTPVTAQGAQQNTMVIKKVVKADGSTLKECLENLDKGQWGNCTVITIPCIPNLPDCSQPEIPDTNQPETPGTPDNNEPEAPGTPDVDVPETNTPDTSVPETPDNSAPELPDTDIPGNGVPDNSASETPDTEQPGQDDTTQSEHEYVLRVVELVNEERAKAGLKPLTLEKNITAAAQVRAVETEQSFSHTRPDGRHFSTALKEAGVTYRGAGENIAWGQKTPEQVMNGWMNSAGHRANILNEKFTSIGVGYHQNANGVNYWSQLFTY